MKKIIKNIKYVSLAAVFAIGILVSAPQAHAGMIFGSPYAVPYDVVSGSGSCPNAGPTANAGVNRVITLPTNSLTIPAGGATGIDPEGGVMTYQWYQFGSSPSTATITGDTTLTPTFSNLVQGTYTFFFTVTDDCGTPDTSVMTVTVQPVGSNQPPVANAGPDQNISQPSSAITVVGSGTDPDGTITGQTWSQISGPSAAAPTAPGSMSTSITALTTVGTYVFQLDVVDDGTPGLHGTDTMQVVVSAAAASSGALTIDPNTCTIALNGSTCSVTGAYWNTTGASSPKLVDVNTNTTLSTLANNPIGTKLLVWAAYPSTTFELRDGASVLDSRVVATNCGANTWNGTKCVVPPINGVCSAPAIHFFCSAGTPINQNTTPTQWTWNCQGSNGGSTSGQCTQAGGSTPNCFDGIQNQDETGIDTGGVCGGGSGSGHPVIKEREL